MTTEDGIPENMQRILKRIGRLVKEFQELDATVVVRPEPWSVQIFLAIESGLHRFDEIQNHLGRNRNILTDQLHTMEKLGILTKRRISLSPRRYEYRINFDDDGSAGQPAMVPV
jgi:DNA-binding HxlR family transcriptional regulator